MRQRSVWFGLIGLFFSLSGCSSLWVRDDTTKVPPPAPGEPIHVGKVEDDGPKRMPKANTCIKWGDWFTASAFNNSDTGQQLTLCNKARQAYEQAIEIDHQNADAFLGLARLYEKWEKPELALAAYEKAVKQIPTDAQIWFEFGMFQNRRRESEQAIEYLRRACSLDPTNPTYSNFLGWTLTRAGRPDEGFVQFRRSVSEAQAYCNLARMFHHQGQDDLCRQYLQAALKADPNLKDAKLLIAQLDDAAPSSEQ